VNRPTRNAALAWRVLDHIDANPDQWDQEVWISRSPGCGTAACFAGWACLLSGDQPEFDTKFDSEADVVYANGDVALVQFRAQKLLGVTASEQDDLFALNNTREDLGNLVAEIFGPRPGGAA